MLATPKGKLFQVEKEWKEKEKHLLVVLEKLQEESVRKRNWGLQLKRKAQVLQQELNTINSCLEREAADIAMVTRLIGVKKLELLALQNAPPPPPPLPPPSSPSPSPSLALSLSKSARKRKAVAKQTEILPELLQIKKRLKQKQHVQLQKITERMLRRKELRQKSAVSPAAAVPPPQDPKKKLSILNEKMKKLLNTRMGHLEATLAKQSNRRTSLQRASADNRQKLPDQRYRPKKMKPVRFDEGVVMATVGPEILDVIGLLFWSFFGSLALREWPVGVHEEAKVEELEDATEFVERTTNSKPYCSPLGRLGVRAYRLSQQFMNVFSSLSSLTLSNNIDPKVLFCRYDIQGRCNDDACDWQHMRSIGLRSEQLSQDLAALRPTEAPFKVATACEYEEASWRNEKKVSRVRMRASKPSSHSNPSIESAKTGSLVDIRLPNVDLVDDARVRFEALVSSEPGAAHHWLAYSKMFKDHQGERLKVLARAIEHNTNNDMLWGEYLRIYAQQARSVDMEQMLSHATTYCSTALHLWVSSARYRTRLMRALSVCKAGIEEQIPNLSLPALLTGPEDKTTAMTIATAPADLRPNSAALASFNVRGLLTLAVTLCCDAGRPQKAKILLEAWFSGQYIKHPPQLARQLELPDQLRLWLTYIFVVAFQRVPMLTDPFLDLCGPHVWRYSKNDETWNQMVIAAVRKALDWFKYSYGAEFQELAHRCNAILRAHLIALERAASSSTCPTCREVLAADYFITPHSFLLSPLCLCALSWRGFSHVPAICSRGCVAVETFGDNPKVWLKFAQDLVESHLREHAIRLLVLFLSGLGKDRDVTNVYEALCSENAPNVDLAVSTWTNYNDRSLLPVETWRCYCLLQSLTKPLETVQMVFEESLNECAATTDRDWLWRDFVASLKDHPSKMLLAVDRFVSELLTRPDVRNYVRNQEVEFGVDLEQTSCVAPYVLCNQIVHMYVAQERSSHRISALYETVCRLLPNNVLLGLSWARFEIESRSARLGRAQQHLYNLALMFPRIPAVFQCLSQIVLSTGRPELARKYLRSGLEHNPLSAALVSDLVQLESTHGELSTAESIATDALQRGSAVRRPVSRAAEVV